MSRKAKNVTEADWERARALVDYTIYELPQIANPDRRAQAEDCFLQFCNSYFPSLFYLPFSADHLEVINKTQKVVSDGGLFAIAMPRGSGKTTLCQIACLWAVLSGKKKFVVLIGAEQQSAEQNLAAIKTQLETNPLLLEDWPEVCVPIRKIDGRWMRTFFQKYKEEFTRITWKQNKLVLPTISGAKTSGAVIQAFGVLGRIRGLVHTTGTGEQIRPDIIFIDDFQTDQSAVSITQCEERERILNGAILGLGGPGIQISGLACCTVIRQGDVADRLLNPIIYPQWNGSRCKMIYKWPKNQSLWADYKKLWIQGHQEGTGNKLAHEFYVKNKEKMDEGAEVGWPERKYPNEESALEHAYNLLLERGDDAFFAEFQNTPLEKDIHIRLTINDILAKTSNLPILIAPLNTKFITAFIDVQEKILFFTVMAFGEAFTSHVLYYGTYPKQSLPIFTANKPPDPLNIAIHLEARISAALNELFDHLFSLQIQREDGVQLSIDKIGVDAAHGLLTETIFATCRQHKKSSQLIPTFGRFIGASSRTLEQQAKPGDRVGKGFRYPVKADRGIRYLLIDTNHFKSFLYERLKTPKSDIGSFSIHGQNPKDHTILAQHLLSEAPVEVISGSIKKYEWRLIPNRENHLLDCIVGCFALAAFLGLSAVPQIQSTQRLKLSQLQRKKLGI